MKCPKCSNENYYYGIQGHDCANPICLYFKNGKVNGEILKVQNLYNLQNIMGDYVPGKTEFVYYKNPPRLANTGNFRPWIYVAAPWIMLIQHPEVFIDTWFAGHVRSKFYLECGSFTKEPEGEDSFPGYISSSSPLLAAQMFFSTYEEYSINDLENLPL